MNNFDNESNIISYFQNCSSVRETGLFPFHKNTETIYQNVVNKGIWSKWTVSSGKGDPPPDFYSEELGLMLEVMRVDDHTFVGKKGKPINPTNSAESRIQRELQSSGIFQLFPNVKQVITIPDTGLSTKEDHNYGFYISNFKSVLEKHRSSVNLYRKNHPSKKLVFFVFDESSAYMQLEDERDATDVLHEGKAIRGFPHFHFCDENLISQLQLCGADYLIWYTPFKYFQFIGPGIVLPKTCVYDINTGSFETKYYRTDLMISTET